MKSFKVKIPKIQHKMINVELTECFHYPKHFYEIQKLVGRFVEIWLGVNLS